MVEHDDLNKSVNIDDLTSYCLQCEAEFIPDESGQECCNNVCASAWYGWDHWVGDEYYGIDWI